MSAWRSDPTPATSSALVDVLGEFLDVLENHLDEEEQVVVPLIDRYLTEAEWQDVGKPPPVKVLWHLIGKRKYRRYITPVRGGQLV